MHKTAEDYLNLLEQKLIHENWLAIEFEKDWIKQFPSMAGVYALREERKICYIGETGDIKKRMRDLLDTRNHSLRRTVGKLKFAEWKDFEMATPSRKFPLRFEEELNSIFKSHFEVSTIEVIIGRKELEERLIEKFKPKYNKREKRKPD